MNALDLLNGYLKSLESRLRWVAIARGAAIASLGALAATIILVLIANHYSFAENVLITSRVLLFLSISFAVCFGLVIPLLHINRRRVARRAEKDCPEFRQRLVTFAERSKSGEQDPFMELLAADTLQVAKQAEPNRVAPTSWIAAFASGAAAAVAILGWLIVGGPGFLGYGSNLLWAGPPKISTGAFYDILMQPGDRTVRRRSDQTVSAQLVGFHAPVVRLFAKYRGTSKWETVNMQPQGTSYEFVFAGIPDTVEYYADAAGVRSKTFTLTTMDLPSIKKMRVTYRYPSWLGLPSVTEDPGADLRAVAGTEAVVEIETDRPLKNGVLAFDDDTQIALANKEGNWVSAKVTIQKDGLYHLAAIENSQSVRLSEDFFVEAKKDREPVVKIRRPGRDAKVSPMEEVSVEVEAEDDFGLQDVQLKYSVNGAPEKSVALMNGKNLKQVNGRTMLSLEDFKLVPGDVVSIYAVARDARTTTQTDMYFLEAQPYEREYTQSQQAGGGGGGEGGEKEDNKISQRQKEIIAATFNQIKTRSQEKSQMAENSKFLSEVQGKLSEQAKSLAERMRSRELAGANQEFQDFAKNMDTASASMVSAVEQLKTGKWKDALPHEQKALQFLMRAEAIFKKIQVAFGNKQAGGGGGGGGAGRDLESLFDLELDTEKNQYETGRQQSGSEQRAKEVDEALQKLEQLARRQQELAEQAKQKQPQTFQQRWQQEMLRREAEDLQRKMEQLTRGGQQQQQGQQQGQQQSAQQGQQGQQGQQQGQQGQQGQKGGQQQGGQQQAGQQAGQQGDRLRQMGGQGSQAAGDKRIQQALQNIEQALKDMRKAGAQDANGSPQSKEADARRAAERLSEAKDLMSSLRKQETSDKLGDVGRQADDLAAKQREFADKMKQKFGAQQPGQSGMQTQDPRESAQLADEKQKLAGDLDRLEREMQSAVRDLQTSQRGAATKLRDALGDAQKNQLDLRMKIAAEYIRRGLAPYIAGREQSVTTDIEAMRDQIKQAQGALDKNGAKGSEGEKSLAGIEKLREQMQRLGQSRQNGQRQGGQQQGGQQQGGQQEGGQQQGGQQQAGQQQGGQQGGGQKGGGQKGGQQGDGQQGGGQQGGNQRGGQRDGQITNTWGGGNNGGNRSGAINYGQLQGPQGGVPSDITPLDTERAYREGMRELGELRRSAESPEMQKDIDALLREMQQIDPRTFPGNPVLLERLNAQIIPHIEQIELQLRRQLEEKQSGQVKSGAAERVPPGYADAVAEYFRKLSRGAK